MTVRVARGEQPDAVRFAVEDHGIGIEPARQAEVFEPFVQVRDSGRHHAGTGLGLAVCKRLVRAMGGEIGLRSAPGQGTTVSFTLRLPSAPAVAGAPASPAQAAPALACGHRVLVVEDDEVNRMVVERFLSALGQQPVCVGDIHAALQALGEQPVELALIDMNLPDGDGREMLARMRALAAQRHTPAVLMSAHIPASEVEGLLGAGFAAFLAKPFTRERLRAVLAELLEGAAAAPPRAAALVLDAPAAGAVGGVRQTAETMAGESVPAAGAETAGEWAGEWVDCDFLRAEEDALGRAVVDDIVAVFRSQGEVLVAELRAGAAAGDAAQCARLAHKLRGAAFNLGLARLGACAASLEQEIAQIDAEGTLAARTQAVAEVYERTLAALDAARGADQPRARSTSTASR